MPKLKTHSGTKDRVKLTKNGKIRAGHPNKNHFLQKKSGARKRSLNGLATLTGAHGKTLKRKLGA
ncbi:MAG TPA: 50S ribosomal protein L35 [Candidatus Saccharimonadales bacterium]|nr:50S ribosomal protein L35 [Candidatus Saccharimonadales bacterium]